MSQQQLGIEANVPEQYLSRWLAGDSGMSDERLTRVCDVLGICE